MGDYDRCCPAAPILCLARAQADLDSEQLIGGGGVADGGNQRRMFGSGADCRGAKTWALPGPCFARASQIQACCICLSFWVRLGQTFCSVSLIPEPFSYTFLFSPLSVGSDEVTENYSLKKKKL